MLRKMIHGPVAARLCGFLLPKASPCEKESASGGESCPGDENLKKFQGFIPPVVLCMPNTAAAIANEFSKAKMNPSTISFVLVPFGALCQ